MANEAVERQEYTPTAGVGNFNSINDKAIEESGQTKVTMKVML